MSLSQSLSLAAIGFLILTVLVHSIGGERYLLRPMFKRRGNAILEHPLARMVLRFAWHLTSLLWLLLAALIWLASFTPASLPAQTFLYTGVLFLTVGLFDLIASKGRHIGWPLLTLVGLTSLAAWWAL